VPSSDRSFSLPAALLAVLAAAAPLSARQVCETFGPKAPAVRVSQSSSGDQFWVQAARGGGVIAFTWSQGQDIFARFFDTSLAPITGDVFVNSNLNAENQDEPAIACSAAGRTLIAWSDRYGYDGQLMGVFARLFAPSGAPLTSEFQVNVAGATSQWRPLLAVTPTGGFVVAWSGHWDGDAFFRVFKSNGSPMTGEVLVNTYPYDAQVDPAPAVGPDGTIFIAFIDYAGHGGVGTGLNLWGRSFTASGAPREPAEVPLTSWASNGDQREPRVAADREGRFLVVWESEPQDGSGYGVFARLFDGQLNALAPEFQVNAQSAGDQRNPTLAVDGSGRFTIAYEDQSTANTRLLARRFDADSQTLGPEVEVAPASAGGAKRVTVAAASTGGDVLFAHEAPGDALDVFARRFEATDGPQVYCDAKPNSAGCLPAISWQGYPSTSTSFEVRADALVNQKSGFLLYALDSRFLPFQGGTLCVASPFQRTPAQATGGNVGTYDCSGTLGFDFLPWIQAGVDPRLVPGATVSAQVYYRDPFDPAGFGSGLTDAIRFTLCP
jgi:hypothetical protein